MSKGGSSKARGAVSSPAKGGTVQYAALPYAIEPDGQTRILLVTSRGTRRWIIPKGWPMRLRSPPKTAEQEAYEEAGVVGRMSKSPVGIYQYDKRLDDGSDLRCTVTVFAMAVDRLDEDWPEAAQRERRWFMQAEAASLVEEPGLRELILLYRPKG